MPVALVTVPHSGMHFAEYVLQTLGVTEFEHETASRNGVHSYSTYLRDYQVVVTLRDPVLCQCSTYNRGEYTWVWDWQIVAAWKDLPNVHFFRVDCPEGEREAEIAALAEFLAVRVEPIDWTPRESAPDVTGMKGAYGAAPPREALPYLLKPAVVGLQNMPEVAALFREHGYDLLWMQGA